MLAFIQSNAVVIPINACIVTPKINVHLLMPDILDTSQMMFGRN